MVINGTILGQPTPERVKALIMKTAPLEEIQEWTKLMRWYNVNHKHEIHMQCRPCYMKAFLWYQKMKKVVTLWHVPTGKKYEFPSWEHIREQGGLQSLIPREEYEDVYSKAALEDSLLNPKLKPETRAKYIKLIQKIKEFEGNQ